ncbi:MAG: hypothetical protein QOI41_1689 [Myxococcales bacterium]|nr:hypothetical protein [Myxococcales bacterium]
MARGDGQLVDVGTARQHRVADLRTADVQLRVIADVALTLAAELRRQAIRRHRGRGWVIDRVERASVRGTERGRRARELPREPALDSGRSVFRRRRFVHHDRIERGHRADAILLGETVPERRCTNLGRELGDLTRQWVAREDDRDHLRRRNDGATPALDLGERRLRHALRTTAVWRRRVERRCVERDSSARIGSSADDVAVRARRKRRSDREEERRAEHHDRGGDDALHPAPEN